MNTGLFRLFAYLLAFAAGAALIWQLFSLQARMLFEPGIDEPAAAVFYMAPLAGLAVFQLIFGGLTGKWRSWKFWLIAIPAIYFPIMVVAPHVTTGYGGAVDAAATTVSIPFTIGLVALFLTRDRS